MPSRPVPLLDRPEIFQPERRTEGQGTLFGLDFRTAKSMENPVDLSLGSLAHGYFVRCSPRGTANRRNFL